MTDFIEFWISATSAASLAGSNAVSEGRIAENMIASILFGRIPENCSRIVLSVVWRPAELDPV